MTSASRDAAKELRPQHAEHLAKFRIPAGLLEAAGVRSVTDAEAREYGITRSGDMAGLLFPYYIPNGNGRVTCRLRRDHPEIEAGKPKNKYVAPYGDARHLYFPPGAHELLQDSRTEIVFVEAEKSALALLAWSERVGRKLLPIGTGGCWGWRGKIGKTVDASGERVDETGPLHDLQFAKQHKVYILFDVNTASNPKVRAARQGLAKELRKHKVDVTILNLPNGPWNGPDDFVGLKGDEAMAGIFAIRPLPGSALIVNEKGKIKSLLANAITMLREAAEWQGVLAFNEFSLYPLTRKATPWGKPAGENWTDTDDIRTSDWLQHCDVLVSPQVAANAVQVIAEENRFHPVKEYLSAIKWDGVERIDRWLVTYLGAPDATFIRAIGSRWLVSAVARIFRPGCQADHTLLLEGPQGIKKSTALRTLAGPEWFTDHISDLDSKDSRLELHGVWIVELAELASVRRSLTEKVKSFLTATSDHFRPPYGRRTIHVPRTNVFAGSINDATPFTDETGNRRFWPVRCGAIDIKKLEADRNQLWAEAVQRYKDNPVWWLDTNELNQLAQEEQEERYEAGVWDEVILKWLENPKQRSDFDEKSNCNIPVGQFNSSCDQVTITDILVHAVGKDIEKCTQSDRNQVARCLAHAGWTLKRKRTSDERILRFYMRPGQ